MKILIGCESSGTVRNAFIAKGHDAWSCDILPSETTGPHIEGDVLSVLDDGWDMAIFHPPCTYLTSAGLHWNKRVPGRDALTEDALEFVRKLMACNIPRWAIENPIGRISTAIRKPDQIIQPYQFGEDASKGTGLWLKGLPLLVPTERRRGRFVEWNGKQVERWSNQTDSGQNKEPPSPMRWKIRSKTYPGIAEAIADQWSSPMVLDLAA